MLGIAQSVLIFVFANFSITFIGQIRTLHFVWSNGYLKYFFLHLFAQLFDMVSYLIMKYFRVFVGTTHECHRKGIGEVEMKFIVI